MFFSGRLRHSLPAGCYTIYNVIVFSPYYHILRPLAIAEGCLAYLDADAQHAPFHGRSGS